MMAPEIRSGACCTVCPVPTPQGIIALIEATSWLVVT